MLIIEIALGIVLGVVILNYLPEILSLGLVAVIALVAIAAIGAALYFTATNLSQIFDFIGSVILVAAGCYAVSILGVIVQDFPLIRKLSDKKRRALNDIPETTKFGRYSAYIFDRFWVGVATLVFAFLLSGLSLAIFRVELGALILPIIVFAILGALRYFEIRKAKS